MATVSTVVVPVGVYLLMTFVLGAVLTRTLALFHIAVMLVTAAVLAAAVVLAATGVSMANCLLVVTLAPVVSVVAHELRGHRHIDAAVTRAFGPATR